MLAKHIDFAGSEMPIYFGNKALYLIEKQSGVPFSQIDTLFDNMTLETMCMIIKIALQEGARKEKKPFEMSDDDILDAMDEMSNEQLFDMIRVISSFAFKGSGGEAGGEEGKR
jgi:hypothetical protein